jgi:hypothetical protein
MMIPFGTKSSIFNDHGYISRQPNNNPDVKIKPYVIDMGRENDVGNIVSAIANEVNIDSRYIGQMQ